MTSDPASIDYAALFAAAPSPYLVLSPDFVVLEVNDAYCAATGRSREHLIGHQLLEAFPDNPGDAEGTSSTDVRGSLNRVLASRLPDALPVQRYDLTDLATGAFLERYWSMVSVPILTDSGEVSVILHRPEDVTDYVLNQLQKQPQDGGESTWRERLEQVEADVYARTRELQAASAAEALANRRLAGLVRVALQLSGAESVQDLMSIIIEEGLAALNADGGAVAVRGEGNLLRFALTTSIGAKLRRNSQDLPLDGPLPACVATRTGQTVALSDRVTALVFAPEMEEVIARTDCQAWIALPLHGSDAVLGALTVGWTEPQQFTRPEVEILEAFAAQCASGLERLEARDAERRVEAATRRMSETLQRSLLTNPPQLPGLECVVRYRPAGTDVQVGGDWYDVFVAQPGRTSIVVGDISGHDQYAAAAMGQIRNLLRGVAYGKNAAPATILSELDHAMRDLAIGTTATSLVAHVRQPDGRKRPGELHLTWSNAGHLPPVLIPPTGDAVVLRTPADLLLGVDADSERTNHELALPRSSTLLLYTDGLVERRGASIDDGLDWLASRVAELATLSADDLCDALLDDISEHAEDDVVLLALRSEG